MLEAFGISDPGCVRNNNEDYYLLSPQTGLFVVADGMGGAQAGENASKLAVDTLAELVGKTEQGGGKMQARAFKEANTSDMSTGSRDGRMDSMGIILDDDISDALT